MGKTLEAIGNLGINVLTGIASGATATIAIPTLFRDLSSRPDGEYENRSRISSWPKTDKNKESLLNWGLWLGGLSVGVYGVMCASGFQFNFREDTVYVPNNIIASNILFGLVEVGRYIYHKIEQANLAQRD